MINGDVIRGNLKKEKPYGFAIVKLKDFDTELRIDWASLCKGIDNLQIFATMTIEHARNSAKISRGLMCFVVLRVIYFKLIGNSCDYVILFSLVHYYFDSFDIQWIVIKNKTCMYISWS